MANFVDFLLELPFWLRVVSSLAIIVILWRILGKGVFWILSLVPFLLRRIFIVLYQIIELPITILHKKLGAGFYDIDNHMVIIGERIDSFFEKWYECWHSHYKFHWGKALIIYFIIVFFIVAPSLFSVDNDSLKRGEELYLFCEKTFIEWIEKQIEEDSIQEVVVTKDEQVTIEKEEMEVSKIELMVSGVNSSLLVRDIPDMEEGIALERLHNGDIVVWAGEMIFAEAADNHIEAWVKVITQNEVDGWSRLFYLHPLNYENASYHITESVNMLAE
ncbi:MAG: hypothetical protein IJZ82_01510 [Lachnospiraceae bacterium]|nr:hypothetical protein [Lachnospiraceae bacterium]